MGRPVIILLLIFGSLGISPAENVVAPTRAEIDAMYTAAAQEVNAGNYSEALKKLDALDARQPDLPIAKNLRGVALMRLGEFGLAEKALQKAKELDPDLWEARYNLAEVPFLQKNWAEARDRFEELAKQPNEQRNASTKDLVQFKIFLTWLLQHKDTQANELVQRLKESSASPAYYCAQAALAFQQQEITEARVNLRAAEKGFPAGQTQLFLESFYEVGWLKKPDGSRPVALKATAEADRAATGQMHLKEAEQAYREGDYDRALQSLEQLDAIAPNEAVTYNLRGQIFFAQGRIDKAESSFQDALAADPQMEEARFNLAQIPLKKGDYEAARQKLEQLQGASSGATDRQRLRQQLIQYEIYLTLLLQNRDSAAQKIMEQFKMTDETPALYYAQAAWAFKHDNSRQAKNWVANAGNLFPAEQNRLFGEPLVDRGWLESTATGTSTPSVTFVQASPSPSVQPIPAATPEKSPATTASENGKTRQSPGDVPQSDSAKPKKIRQEQARERHRGEAETSLATDDREMTETSSAQKKPRRRNAPKKNTAKPSATPIPTPTAIPEPTRRPVLQQFGETVVHVLTSPFRRRTISQPSPTPSSNMTAAPNRVP